MRALWEILSSMNEYLQHGYDGRTHYCFYQNDCVFPNLSLFFYHLRCMDRRWGSSKYNFLQLSVIIYEARLAVFWVLILRLVTHYRRWVIIWDGLYLVSLLKYLIIIILRMGGNNLSCKDWVVTITQVPLLISKILVHVNLCKYCICLCFPSHSFVICWWKWLRWEILGVLKLLGTHLIPIQNLPSLFPVYPLNLKS